jgi:hypothetical protein
LIEIGLLVQEIFLSFAIFSPWRRGMPLTLYTVNTNTRDIIVCGSGELKTVKNSNLITYNIQNYFTDEKLAATYQIKTYYYTDSFPDNPVTENRTHHLIKTSARIYLGANWYPV